MILWNRLQTIQLESESESIPRSIESNGSAKDAPQMGRTEAMLPESISGIPPLPASCSQVIHHPGSVIRRSNQLSPIAEQPINTRKSDQWD